MEKLGAAGDFSPIRRIWLGISRIGLTRWVSSAMMPLSEASSASGSDLICKAQAGKDRVGAGGAVRRGHGRQAGSQESAGRPGARRPAPGSGFRTSPDRCPRLETGSISPGSRRPPPPRVRASHRKTSSRMGAPDRAGTVRIPTGNRNSPGRNEAPPGAAGRFRPTDRRQAAATGGQGRGQDQPPSPMAASPYGSCGRWRAFRSPEKLTGFRSGRLLGASSRPPGRVH